MLTLVIYMPGLDRQFLNQHSKLVKKFAKSTSNIATKRHSILEGIIVAAGKLIFMGLRDNVFNIAVWLTFQVVTLALILMLSIFFLFDEMGNVGGWHHLFTDGRNLLKKKELTQSIVLERVD